MKLPAKEPNIRWLLRSKSQLPILLLVHAHVMFFRHKVKTCWVEAIAARVEAIAARVEAIAIRVEDGGGHKFLRSRLVMHVTE